MSTQGNGLKRFERALSNRTRRVYVLRLYVSGASPKSLEAIKNIKAVCDANLAGRHKLEIVDIYQQPERAVLDQVVAAPMLVKLWPLPLRRLIGPLSNARQLLHTLDLIRTEHDRAVSEQHGR
jgi:circadian clock protein KaiB